MVLAASALVDLLTRAVTDVRLLPRDELLRKLVELVELVTTVCNGVRLEAKP